jgi:hypothetical protein
MLHRFFFPAIAVLALAMVALALVWPQGLGDRSPGPFGHTPIQRTPEMQAAMRRETEGSQRDLERARAVVADRQAEAIAPQQ